MEVQVNKGMKMYLFVIKAVFAIIAITNLVFSVYDTRLFHPTVFGILDVCVWFYGVLCAHGYFRKVTSDVGEDDQIISETSVPYIAVIVARIVQLAYSVLAAMNTTNYRVLLLLIGLDLIYTVILLMYKASYYYISLPYSKEEEEE